MGKQGTGSTHTKKRSFDALTLMPSEKKKKKKRSQQKKRKTEFFGIKKKSTKQQKKKERERELKVWWNETSHVELHENNTTIRKSVEKKTNTGKRVHFGEHGRN